MEYHTPEQKKTLSTNKHDIISISHLIILERHAESVKTDLSFIQKFYFPNAPFWIKILCNNCISCQISKPFPHQKQLAEKQDFKGKIFQPQDII